MPCAAGRGSSGSIGIFPVRCPSNPSTAVTKVSPRTPEPQSQDGLVLLVRIGRGMSWRGERTR
jgi:hypothetical protein